MDEHLTHSMDDDDDVTGDDTTADATYEAFFRSAYDNKFTTDISNKMQMPDRLGPISNPLDSYVSLSGSPATKGHQTTGHDIMYSMDPSYYMVGTPPRVLTAQHAMYSDDEDDDDGNLIKQYAALNNGFVNRMHPYLQLTPQLTPERSKKSAADNNGAYNAAAVPMTPGTLLVAQSGDEMALVRRQLGKLISHVRRLEDENSRRAQREYVLYPLVLGFCVFQIAKLIIGYK